MPRLARTMGASLATTAMFAIAACGVDTGTGGDTATADDDTLNVVVSFYPLQFTGERVAGPAATVTNLTQPGAHAHDLELTPRQIASLSEADVVIYQKGFQPAVDEAVAQADPAHVLDVSTVVAMHPVASDGDHDHAHGAEAATEPASPAAQDHGGRDHGGRDHEGHDHDNVDPHVWLDLENMSRIADATATTMGEARPQDEQTFRSNAEALSAEYGALDESFATGLATCARREFIVSHAAFGYLADRYDLTQIPIRGLNPDLEPSPARVAEVHELAREHEVTTIFYETLVSPVVAEAIAGDLDLQTDVLDPLERLTPQSRGDDYIEVMNANLTALKVANECS